MADRTDKRMLSQQRNLVADAIRAASDNGDYSSKISAVEVKPYRPMEVLGIDESSKTTFTTPRIIVTGVAFDEATLTRVTKQRMMYIRVFVEAMVESTDEDKVDALINLCDQVMETCSTMEYWVRTEAARDEHNMPYLYHILREKAFFQGIFHPTYNVNASR